MQNAAENIFLLNDLSVSLPVSGRVIVLSLLPLILLIGILIISLILLIG